MALTRTESPALARRVMAERAATIEQARVALEAMQRASADAQRAALALQVERDRLNAAAPADSPEAFAARWERIAILDGAIANASAWRSWWQPRLAQADAAYRTALRVQPLAYEQAMEAELAPLFADVERLRTSPHRAHPEVERQHRDAIDAYEAARARWATVWESRKQ